MLKKIELILDQLFGGTGIVFHLPYDLPGLPRHGDQPAELLRSARLPMTLFYLFPYPCLLAYFLWKRHSFSIPQRIEPACFIWA